MYFFAETREISPPCVLKFDAQLISEEIPKWELLF